MVSISEKEARLFAATLVLLGALSGCATTLPPLEPRTDSVAHTDTAGTRLGRAVAAGVEANEGRTGVHPLPNPLEALAARLALAAAADMSIDVQYYIWHGDEVGYLLFEALWSAAERGVRVRLLLDDANTSGLDSTISALDAHANIEVRLYNPFVQRGSRLLGFLTDFSRLNRRMHNKSFTVDNQVAIVGGRNIGNEYFAAGGGTVYADLDVAAVGPAVRAVSKQFDVYWNSRSAYPVASLVVASTSSGAGHLEAKFREARAGRQAGAYAQAVRDTRLVHDILERRVAFQWAPAQVLYDSPEKTLDTSTHIELLLFPELVRTIGRPQKSFDLVTPYFVPGEQGTAALVALAGSGVKVRILTNSLAATDVGAVHAGYARRRQELLRAGVQLFELKPTAGQVTVEANAGYGSSSSSGLHAKTFAVDGARAFVGSFNFDQRSARLNTELGLVIESPVLARHLAAGFDRDIPLLAYEARLTADGSRLEWIERTPTGDKRYDTEPNTSIFRRMGVGFMSILPIEWLL